MGCRVCKLPEGELLNSWLVGGVCRGCFLKKEKSDDLPSVECSPPVLSEGDWELVRAGLSIASGHWSRKGNWHTSFSGERALCFKTADEFVELLGRLTR